MKKCLFFGKIALQLLWCLRNGMLHEAKRIEDAEFWLTDIDIANFDPFKPVYVAKFGAYFVVNKIKNYESGKLTKVDLIKI